MGVFYTKFRASQPVHHSSASQTFETNLEIFSILWLDSSIDKKNEHQEAQKRLACFFNDFRIFDNLSDAVAYVTRAINDRIVVIVNGEMAYDFVTRIHNVDQVLAIYIYCNNRENYTEWVNQFSKVNCTVFVYEKFL